MPILRSAKWLASTFSLSSHRQWYDVDAWLDSTLQITVFPQPMSWVVRSLFAGNYVGKVYKNKQIRPNARTWMNKAMFSSMLAMLVIWRIFSCGKHNFPNLCPSQWIFLWVVKQTIAYIYQCSFSYNLQSYIDSSACQYMSMRLEQFQNWRQSS